MASKNIIKETSFESKNIKVIGIVSNLSIHRLAWMLNQELDWDLERVGDVMQESNGFVVLYDENNAQHDTSLSFPLHSFKDEGNKFDVDLITNKTPTSFLLKELKELDYILLLNGEMDFIPEKLLERISKLSQVLYAGELELKKIKNSQILLGFK